jgi:RNA polymerase sigma-70 factor, ECF subfamily
VTQERSTVLEDLRAVFLAHVDGGGGGSDPDDLDAKLRLLWEEGRAAWPGVALDPARFVAHLAERVTPGPDLAQALAELRAADLYLACACQHDVRGAIARFDEALAPTVSAFVRHVDRSPGFADEVRQLLLHKLFVVGKDGAPPKIIGYQGRGPLASWVGVAAQRTGLTMLRGPREQPDDQAIGEALSPGVDPELDYLKMRYRAEFREALEAAFTSLPQRDRMILRLSVVKGLSHASIAAMYKVNQATVTRWIGRMRKQIAAEAHRKLRERLDVSTEELDSIEQLVVSQLDLSVTRWLGED